LGTKKPGDSTTLVYNRGVKSDDGGKAKPSAVWSTSLRRFDRIQVGSDVYIFGYPTSIGLKRIPQIDYDRPLVQKGIVAGLNHKKKTIVLNIAAYFGNSGGPVVEVEKDRSGPKFVPIGIVSEYIPFEEQQINVTRNWHYSTITSSPYSVAEPLDPVIDIIQSWK
jgi:hypothetical protein